MNFLFEGRAIEMLELARIKWEAKKVSLAPDEFAVADKGGGAIRP